MYNHLNKESLQRIENIVNGFRNYPAYAAYTIKSYCMMFIQVLMRLKSLETVNL